MTPAEMLKRAEELAASFAAMSRRADACEETTDRASLRMYAESLASGARDMLRRFDDARGRR